MTTLAIRQTWRKSFLSPYRESAVLWERSLADGSEVRIFPARARQGHEAQPESVYYLIAFARTAGRPCEHFRFRSLESAVADAEKFLAGRTAHHDMLATSKTSRAAWKTTLTPGRILRHAGGYDQTNIDYYQVVDVTPSGKSCTVRKIGARSMQDGFNAGVCWPLADEFIDEPTVKRIGQGDSVKVCAWGSWAYPWTPQADRWTDGH